MTHDEQMSFLQRVEYEETREERLFRQANDPARLARIPPYLRPRRALARTTDVETSHDAVPPATRRRTQMLAIMRLYNDDPRGLTADECSVILGDEVWRRVSDLRTEGLLTWLLDADDRPVKRPTRSGRDARVLVRVLDPL